MGWTIFAIYMVLGIVINLFALAGEDAKVEQQNLDEHRHHMTEKEIQEAEEEIKRGKEASHQGMMIGMWVGIVLLSIFLLYCIGWLWYYFCGGFLLFEDQPFLDKVVCGLISVLLLGFLGGFIAICFGWDPKK